MTFYEHYRGCPYIRKTSLNKDWESCYSMTIGGFRLNKSDSDSLTLFAYVTPGSPSSITALDSATHTPPSFDPEMDTKECL